VPLAKLLPSPAHLPDHMGVTEHMNRERRDRLLETLFQIRPGELPLTGLLFAQCLCVVGAFIVARSVRDALFLAQGTRDSLPLMYVASALAVSFVGLVYSRFADRARREMLAFGFAAGSAALFVAARLLLSQAGEWVLGVFYVLVEVVGTLTVIQFWTLANELFTARDARRLFGIIGAGGTLANILLGSAVGALAKMVGAENLVFLAAMLLAGVAVFSLRLGRRVPLRLSRARASKSAGPPKAKVFAFPHLKLVAAMAALTFFATTLIDFQFKTIAASTYSKDSLAAFFGIFYAATGGLALVVQLAGTSRFLNRFGVIAALALLPSLLGAGSVTVLLFPVLWAATATKGSEFVLRYTLHDATVQLLYQPVPAYARAGAKAFIDGVGKPAAIALSGLALMGYKALGNPRLDAIAVASAVGCLGWLAVVLALRGGYVRSLQETLRRRRHDFAAARSGFDPTTAQVLLKALDSTSGRDVLHPLELLPRERMPMLARSVSGLLAHPEAAVRAGALDWLRDAGSLQDAAAAAALLKDSEPTVRRAAAQALDALLENKASSLLRRLLSDPVVEVRAAAIAGLLRHGGLEEVLTAASALQTLVVSPDPKVRLQAARALGAIEEKRLYAPVFRLMGDSAASVRLAAIQAAGRMKAPELVLPLLHRLGSEETRAPAREALVSFGPGVVPLCAKVLENPSEDPAIRRAVPQLLGRLGTAGALEILSAHLSDGDEWVRRSIYKALGHVLRRQRSLTVDRKRLLRAVELELERAYRTLACAHALGLPEVQAGAPVSSAKAEVLLASALAEKVKQCEDRAFTLLGILYPDAEVELLYAGFQGSGDPEAKRRRSNAIELLDNLLDRPLRQRLFPLLEDVPRDARLRAAAPLFALPSTADKPARLRELLVDENAWVRACALYLAGESTEASLVPAMRESLDHPSAVVREACLAALEKVCEPAELLRVAQTRLRDGSEQIRLRAETLLARLDGARMAG